MGRLVWRISSLSVWSMTTDHDVLTQAAEEGLHDLEESCFMHVCDTGKTDQLICDEEHDEHEEEEDSHDHDHVHEDEEESSSAARKSVLVGTAAVLAMLM